MKMRFWKKTYIFTLVLFLLCLNAGILTLTVYTHNKSVETTETAVSAEQYYVAMSFERDFEDMSEKNHISSPSLLMESFGRYYQSKGLFLEFRENGMTVYSNFENQYTIDKNTIKHMDFNGKRHIIISSEICENKYEMIFAKNVEELDHEFKSLMITYGATAIIVSVFLAICLYFILKKLSSPLERLRKTTETIESGNFSIVAEEKGNDEFTLLAKSFNKMIAKINEQIEALEKEAERKQMLVDNMAHELRTPLTSIQGYAEYIEKANSSEERKHIAAKYIISEAMRLQKISEILLDSAFINGNEIKMSKVNIAEILSDVTEKLSIKAKKENIELLYTPSDITAHGNETLLSMLFYNIVENGIKACADGGMVKISSDENRVIIEDNGKGMTEEQLIHITEPFYRTDKSRSRAEGGAGLGLALCKQIVTTHKAELKFESKPQKGTKVIVSFPKTEF